MKSLNIGSVKKSNHSKYSDVKKLSENSNLASEILRIKKDKNAVILVTGSLYFVGEILNLN